MAYVLIQFGSTAGKQLLMRHQAILPQPTVLDDSLCQQSYSPHGTALSPLALSSITGDPQATTDRLIVAARHAEVGLLFPPPLQNDTD